MCFDYSPGLLFFVLFFEIVFLFWCLILLCVLAAGPLSFVLARCFYCCVWFACVLCLWSCLCSQKIKRKTTSTNMEHRTRTRTLLFLFCSLKLCFFFGVWYRSLFLLLVRCPLFLLVVSIVVFGLLVFIVSDLVFVLKKSNEKQRARVWNKNKNTNT